MDLSRVTQRLIDLDRAASEEDEPLRIEVLQQCCLFLEAHDTLAQPHLTVTPNGTLRARWGTTEAFTCVEFLGGRILEWIGTNSSSPGMKVEKCAIDDSELLARLYTY